ncbi:MAG: response regulator transcription factor [Lachnospiraceae bacterium]|nr:response regulator transcription factor [Lachnospiraceae bacterium]
MAEIYIVEDDTNILEIESFALENTGYKVTGFENAAAFFEAVSNHVPDLVLLDIMLPDIDGIKILKRLRKNEDTKQLPIIMVTAKTSEIDAVRGLDSGADDYITKPFGVMELISRVKALLRRVNQEEELSEYKVGNVIVNSSSRKCFVDGVDVELTYKEFELLLLLIKNAGIVMKRDTLLETIWGIEFEGESRTLDMHIKTLRKKLGEESSHIETVRNVGYVIR